MGCALERMVTHSGLHYDAGKMGPADEKKLAVLREAAGAFFKALRITLTDDELCYIANMI